MSSALPVYWADDALVVADDAHLPAFAGRGIAALPASPAAPLYLVIPQRPGALDRARAIAPALWSDSAALLVAADDSAAHRITLAGCQLVRLPDRPAPLYAPAAHGFPAPLLDTTIQRLVARVSADSVRRHIQRLQDFRTRYSPADSCRSAESWIAGYFTALGFDSVALDSFQRNGQYWRNAVGLRRGRNPEKVVIVCGHLDCTSEDPYNSAPGAEDNASGTAMVLEAARVLADLRPDLSIRFIGFSGEEQGLIGSFHYAEQARARGDDIIAVMNYDMIAYPGGEFGVAIFGDSLSLPLGQFQSRIADIYTRLDSRALIGRYGSDQLAFHRYGYIGTAGAEYGDFYPWYHTTADTIGNISMELAAEVAKMTIAAAATIALAPAPPDSFRFADLGTGGALFASWRPNREPDVAGYRLWWGTQSGSYTDSVDLPCVPFRRIEGLTNGTRYYAAVAAFDSAGHLGGRSAEQSAIPGEVPLAPEGFAAWPARGGMKLSWRANTELDLAGYNLYRATVSGGPYDRLNTAPVTDTTFRDSGLASGIAYYYVCAAVDTTGNEGPRSPERSGKAITLDRGILLVDETRNGTGARGSPSDEQQDAFWHFLLGWFNFTDWDATDLGVPAPGDLGPYSTVVWHADEYQQQLAADAVPGLANYLSEGGRLFYSGWKPILGILGSGNYPFTFSPGSFPYDQLGLAVARQSTALDFIGATGTLGYPDLRIDSLKTFPAAAGRLSFIDALYPRDAEPVAAFVSQSGDTFAGKPVAVRRLAGPGKVVFLGFPLYYCENEPARAFAVKALSDLGEPYALTEPGPPAAAATPLSASHVRAILKLPADIAPHPPHLLIDATGRRVLELKPGTNDISNLAPGVYFIRQAQPDRQTVSRPAVRVIITR